MAGLGKHYQIHENGKTLDKEINDEQRLTNLFAVYIFDLLMRAPCVLQLHKCLSI